MSDLLSASYRGLDPLIRFNGEFDSGSLHEFDGALASVAPAIPLAAMFSAAIFDRSRPQTLAAALDRMWPVWDESGVAIWSAWVVEGDEQAEAIAAGRGMSVGIAARAMGAELSEIDLTGPTNGVVERWDMRVAAALNERAYGLPPGLFGAVAAAERPDGARCFISHEGERPVAMTISFPSGKDCSIGWVAADPTFQGKGHARAAMTAALVGAREDGFVTTTLQASKAGVPLYLALGYRDLRSAINLWQYARGA
ncbi:MAG: GNAT family N-acetyltransferase [Solirubrobacterales bacterium]